MAKKDSTFRIGDQVFITKKGLERHRKHHDTNSKLIAFASDFTPVANTLKKASNELWTESQDRSLEASIGTIKEVRQRWFWQPGHDYLVEWGEGEKSWHLSKHLKPAQ